MKGPPHRVDTVLASAGTGKTTTLVRLITEAIADGVAPEKIVATTFTVRSAEELMERARLALVADGMAERAGRLLDARVGTVNAVCGRLVSEFALETGRAPSGEVIPEDAVRATFALAADRTIAEHAPRLNALAEAFGLAARGVDWRDEVLRIVDLSRAYGIPAERLPVSAERSVRGFLELLPSSQVRSEADLDGALDAAAREVLASIAASPPRAAGVEVAQAAREVVRRYDRGEVVPWPLWAKLAAPRTSRDDARRFDRLASAASGHSGHPRLRRQAAELIEGGFACAAAALAAYQAYKAAHGLLDFTDQETLALEILRRPDTRARLQGSVEMVLVDEIQDSSPLQVAIFSELARIARRSVWVGDPKQAIYGFRGTDADLTLAACREAAAATGGACEVLSRSWRSQPGLCTFVNDAFAPAFEAMGIPASGTRFSGSAREEVDAQSDLVASWSVAGRDRSERAAGLAGGIAAALNDAGAWRVGGPQGARNLKAGDVAVLCRSNAQVERVASALAALRVPVAVGRGDLLETPEVELVAAAIRWVADASDGLALAEMARLLCASATDWLAALSAEDPDAALRGLVPFASALDDIRVGYVTMTPCEVVDAVIVATGMMDIVCRWGDARTRLRHLEAFREVPRTYEREASRLGSAATVRGLVAWLSGRSLQCPRSPEPDSVCVTTYHRAKGLEWPMVIMTELGREASPRVFDVCGEADGPVNWRSPLEGRWVRFWPWPYGRQVRGLPLEAAARASKTGCRAASAAREEALRLLYVGATRARDHLVFVREGSRSAAWLSVLDTNGRPHLSLPERNGDPIRAGTRCHPVRSLSVRAGAFRAEPPAPEVSFLAPERPRRRLRPLRVRPSAAAASRQTIVAVHELGGRLASRDGVSPDLLGRAVHAFLASDALGDTAARQRRASMIVARWDIAGSLGEDDLMAAADRLWSFLAGRFPRGDIRREVPVHAELGRRILAGRIDVLVDDGHCFAIVDHKSLIHPQGTWDASVAAYGSQLQLYAHGVARETGKKCSGLFVHLPFAGTVLELRPRTVAHVPPLPRERSASDRSGAAMP